MIHELLQVRGLPSLPAVPALGLPDMPQIALPASAESLVAPIPAPRPQASLPSHSVPPALILCSQQNSPTTDTFLLEECKAM